VSHGSSGLWAPAAMLAGCSAKKRHDVSVRMVRRLQAVARMGDQELRRASTSAPGLPAPLRPDRCLSLVCLAS
jgi:hypothetical protein